MKNLIIFLKELESEKLKKTETKRGLIITTSQRNEIRRNFQKAIEKDIKEAVSKAYDSESLFNDIIIGETAEGLIVAPEHKSVPDTVPFKVIVKVGNLDFDSDFEIKVFEAEQQEKTEKLEKRSKAKNEKIARDKEMYEALRLRKEKEKEALLE